MFQRLRSLLGGPSKELTAAPSGPTTLVAEANDQSEVCLTGRVKPSGEALRAPYSQRACVWWQIRVHALLRSSDVGSIARGKVAVKEENGTDFLLRDASGEALVQASSLAVDALERELTQTPNEAAWRDWLRWHARELLGKELFVFERIVALDQHVTLVGKAQWQALALVPYRESTPRRLVVVGSASNPIRVFAR